MLDITANELKLALHLETEFHMAIPETKEFLKADLTGDPTADLKVAREAGISIIICRQTQLVIGYAVLLDDLRKFIKSQGLTP